MKKINNSLLRAGNTPKYNFSWNHLALQTDPAAAAPGRGNPACPQSPPDQGDLPQNLLTSSFWRWQNLRTNHKDIKMCLMSHSVIFNDYVTGECDSKSHISREHTEKPQKK